MNNQSFINYRPSPGSARRQGWGEGASEGCGPRDVCWDVKAAGARLMLTRDCYVLVLNQRTVSSEASGATGQVGAQPRLPQPPLCREASMRLQVFLLKFLLPMSPAVAAALSQASTAPTPMFQLVFHILRDNKKVRAGAIQPQDILIPTAICHHLESWPHLCCGWRSSH